MTGGIQILKLVNDYGEDATFPRIDAFGIGRAENAYWRKGTKKTGVRHFVTGKLEVH